MASTNITGSGTNAQTFEESLCSSVWVGEFKQQSISFSAINILLFTTAILGNSLILVALHKELPSIRHPNSCIVVWQRLIYWLVLLPSLSILPTGCLWFTNTGVFVSTQGTQSTFQAMHYVQCLC